PADVLLHRCHVVISIPDRCNGGVTLVAGKLHCCKTLTEKLFFRGRISTGRVLQCCSGNGRMFVLSIWRLGRKKLTVSGAATVQHLAPHVSVQSQVFLALIIASSNLPPK